MLDSVAPFGGRKQSGFGKELGLQALDMHKGLKSVWIDFQVMKA